MPIRLIALDLDGTLLDPSHRLSPANIAAVQACRERNIRVVLATGRMFSSARGYAETLGLDTPLIALNGAITADPTSGTMRIHAQLHPARMAPVLRLLNDRMIPYVIFGPNAIYAEPTIERRHLTLLESYGDPPAQLLDRSALLDLPTPIKVLSFLEPGPHDREFAALLADQVEVVRTNPAFFEFLPLGVSKGATLRTLLDQWAIAPAEALAIGDGENDLSMFAVVGTSVAMADAPAAVRATAGEQTGSNREDGVAAALERLILKRAAS